MDIKPGSLNAATQHCFDMVVPKDKITLRCSTLVVSHEMQSDIDADHIEREK